jgi:hypothetical protein
MVNLNFFKFKVTYNILYICHVQYEDLLYSKVTIGKYDTLSP